MNKNLLPTAAVLALVTGNATVAMAAVTMYGTTAPVASKTITAPAGTQGYHGGAVGPYQATSGGVAGGLETTPPTLTAPYTGTITIHVTDCCQVGDVYQVFFGQTGQPLVSLGDTADASLNGPTLSTGTFTASVTAGTNYTLNFADVTMQYIGTYDPYGTYVDYSTSVHGGHVGGHTVTGSVASNVIPTGFSPTGAGLLAFATQTYTPTPGVPEPATLSLLGSGLISAGLLRRRRTRKS